MTSDCCVCQRTAMYLKIMQVTLKPKGYLLPRLEAEDKSSKLLIHVWPALNSRKQCGVCSRQSWYKTPVCCAKKRWKRSEPEFISPQFLLAASPFFPASLHLCVLGLHPVSLEELKGFLSLSKEQMNLCHLHLAASLKKIQQCWFLETVCMCVQILKMKSE